MLPILLLLKLSNHYLDNTLQAFILKRKRYSQRTTDKLTHIKTLPNLKHCHGVTHRFSSQHFVSFLGQIHSLGMLNDILKRKKQKTIPEMVSLTLFRPHICFQSLSEMPQLQAGSWRSLGTDTLLICWDSDIFTSSYSY